jgi:hypothetical protein
MIWLIFTCTVQNRGACVREEAVGEDGFPIISLWLCNDTTQERGGPGGGVGGTNCKHEGRKQKSLRRFVQIIIRLQ